ncbi:MAG: hypothetical protein HUJ98_00300 [Bacteroidaceae bacterium]|nr:hypothetical protein [Bacteroidaceae bacterium]
MMTIVIEEIDYKNGEVIRRSGIGVMVNNLVQPSRIMLLLSFICCVTILVVLYKKEKNWSGLVLTGFWLVFINCCYLIIYLSGMADYSGRVTWIFFAGISTTFLLCYYEVKNLRVPVAVSTVVFLAGFVVCMIFTGAYGQDFFLKCDIDRANVAAIESAIENYEKETGNEVTTVSVYASPNMQYTDPSLSMDYKFKAYSYNCKTYNRDWSDVSLINVLENKEYVREAMTEEEFMTRFSDFESWTEFDINKQLDFEGDTLYWAKF